MPHSIAVFGVGPGLGQAVARRYAREGYDVVLVARRKEPLDQLAGELSDAGAPTHVITADLADTNGVAPLAERIRAEVGHLDAFYYGPAGESGGFVPAANLTPEHAQQFLPLSYYSLLALVQEFLPAMIERGDGAVLTAQGASSVRGIPYLSGPGPAQAAQRNYLQSLAVEVAGKGVYVGALYIGAAIKNTPFHAQFPDMLAADPADLADLLWGMHAARSRLEASFPEHLFED